jgi:ribosome biogenesis GTPase
VPPAPFEVGAGAPLEGGPEVHAASSLARLGWDGRRAAELSELRIAGAAPARIARVDRGGGLAIAEDGELAVRGAGLAAGDWVAVTDGAVAAVLPRRSTLSRRAAGAAGAEQDIAANVDVVLVVYGLDRPLRGAASTARWRWRGTRAPCPPWC